MTDRQLMMAMLWVDLAILAVLIFDVYLGYVHITMGNNNLGSVIWRQ